MYENDKFLQLYSVKNLSTIVLEWTIIVHSLINLHNYYNLQFQNRQEKPGKLFSTKKSNFNMMLKLNSLFFKNKLKLKLYISL